MVNSEQTVSIETPAGTEKAINIERIVSEKFPAISRRNPLIKNGLFRFLRWLSREH